MTDDIKNTNVEEQSEYNVPSRQGVNLEPIPLLTEQGWIEIGVDRQKSAVGTLHLSLSDTNRLDESIEFSVRVGRESSLKEVDRDDPQHVQNRNEDGENQNAVTYAAGDFYLDWRRDNDIRCEDGDDQIRVRTRPDVSSKQMIVTAADEISEYQSDKDGSVKLGSEYADRSVTIAIIDSTA